MYDLTEICALIIKYNIIENWRSDSLQFIYWHVDNLHCYLINDYVCLLVIKSIEWGLRIHFWGNRLNIFHIKMIKTVSVFKELYSLIILVWLPVIISQDNVLTINKATISHDFKLPKFCKVNNYWAQTLLMAVSQ